MLGVHWPERGVRISLAVPVLDGTMRDRAGAKRCPSDRSVRQGRQRDVQISQCLGAVQQVMAKIVLRNAHVPRFAAHIDDVNRGYVRGPSEMFILGQRDGIVPIDLHLTRRVYPEFLFGFLFRLG